MSRSVLRNKWMNKKINSLSKKKYSGLKPTSNSHKFDEMPKNRVSKYVRLRCPNAEWLQEPSNFCGHKPHTNGHRMVSGIVRAKVKEEIQNEIDNELNDK